MCVKQKLMEDFNRIYCLFVADLPKKQLNCSDQLLFVVNSVM